MFLLTATKSYIYVKKYYINVTHTQFLFNSRTQNEGHPKWFVLGVGQVIKGLDIAMMNMCPGEKRKVTIPPSLAYGQQGYGKRSSNSQLCLSCVFSPLKHTMHSLVNVCESWGQCSCAAPVLLIAVQFE